VRALKPLHRSTVKEVKSSRPQNFSAEQAAQDALECADQDKQLRLKLPLPRRLVFLLMRYKYNEAHLRMEKIGSDFKLSDTLCFDATVTPAEVDEKTGKMTSAALTADDLRQQDGEHMYQLSVVVIHDGGSAASGHYTVYSRIPDSRRW
jgi:hypothetical protein